MVSYHLHAGGSSERDSNIATDTWSTFKMKHVYQGKGLPSIRYHWSQVSVFTRQSKDKQFVLFVDCPKAVVSQIVQNCLSESSRSVGLAAHVGSACRDPFIWHALLIGGLESEYESDYWRLRDIVRRWERVCHTFKIHLFTFYCGHLVLIRYALD